MKTCRIFGAKNIRSVSIHALVFLLGLFFLSSGRPAEANCDGTLQWIHGRLYLANGTPSVRLRDTKAQVTFGVLTESNPEYPERPIFPSNLVDILSWDADVHGDFLFCIMERIEHHFDMGYVVQWDGSIVRRNTGSNFE